MSFNSLLTNLQLEHFAKIELHMRDSWSIKKSCKHVLVFGCKFMTLNNTLQIIGIDGKSL
jgi:hypothetical protein